VPRVAQRKRVGGIKAARAELPVQIDARVERNAVHRAAGPAVAERVDAGHAAVGIEVAKLCRLLEARAAAVPPSARRELVVASEQRVEPGELSGRAVIVLLRVGAREQATARQVRRRV
jgi:hypothetical protein